MHDLINDLATSVAGEFSFRLDSEVDVSNTNESLDKFCHFSASLRYGSYRNIKELQRAKRLRTLILMSSGWEEDDLLDKVLAELLPELQFLRVLIVMDLSSGLYTSQGSRIITKVPQSIGSLKHLRYLDFSYTGITCVPEQVSHLYNSTELVGS
ncbi:unnamed protein product [Lactuca virosa]|uniref:Uncharacterized protein n=1 Tax=Lactuca virosa TaxID=75947 RepID=A0AAU9NSF8_9ASTR|nr:unnamed protein product [Lactuca virosa]